MARVLVVDDDPGVLVVMRRMLEKYDHEVVVANDGGDALIEMDGSRFDLVITDINMPEMDGVELILMLRKRQPDIPVIACSGGGLLPKEAHLANARVLGVVSTLAKPVAPADLREAVDRALAGRQAE